MKSPISILTWLCLLFLASCISNKKTSLEAFKQDVYTPEYATAVSYTHLTLPTKA